MEPPLIWELFDGQKNLVFDYVCISTAQTPAEVKQSLLDAVEENLELEGEVNP
jgi:hypothetical protein